MNTGEGMGMGCVKGLADAEVALLASFSDADRQKCTVCLLDLRQRCGAAGVAYQCTGVRPTARGCVVYVFPSSACSMPAFVRALERAIGCQNDVCVWSHVHGHVEAAIEFEVRGEWTARWEDFRLRATWRQAAADSDTLPVALGVGMRDEDLVIDLADLSALIIKGGDTYAQGVVLTGLMKTLYSVRGRPELETYYMATNCVTMTGCDGFANAAGEMPEANSFHADKSMGAWARKAATVCHTVQGEITARERLFCEAGCDSLAEYNRRAKRPLPRILVFIVDPPIEYGEGDVRAFCEDMDRAAVELFLSCGPRCGVHMVIVDFLPCNKSNFGVMVNASIGGCSEQRVGCLVHGGGVSDAMDSHRVFGGPEACRAGGMTMVYRSPENEVYKVHRLGETDY